MWKRAFKGMALGVTLTATAAPAPGATVLPMGTGAFQVQVVSMAERKWQHVMRQQYDFSCGSAAVATLLTYHYGITRSEADVFKVMYAEGDQAKIRKHGFSMLDLKRYLDHLGLQADGFRMSLDKLKSIGVPAIALVNTQGYQHFVVIKGIRDGEVLIGDPAGGTVPIDRERMEQIWNGIILAARGRIDVGRANFNHPRDWGVRPAAPIATATAANRAALPARGLTLPGLRELGR